MPSTINPDLIAVRERRATVIDISVVWDGRGVTEWTLRQRFGTPTNDHFLLRDLLSVKAGIRLGHPNSVTCVRLPFLTLSVLMTFLCVVHGTDRSLLRLAFTPDPMTDTLCLMCESEAYTIFGELGASTLTSFITHDLIAVRERRATVIDISVVWDGRGVTEWSEK
ncbi:LOW QUALITY PROTEIN: hypothetical protein T265_15098 [Opisthorchis viverrini]|uniref:Uncharacterized protein n=1 Tax=Opisthorchis viverrini TaxID=6198 RepID=A0A074Z2W6_OPIVI|nr:LOW QUALITY PROTEIN: hypothetical protein T265_15098 [Opisthorchis viverrini]KER21411.1 LOW QUALITY PROTEIN: hypothetical protein T265_15098 [Opisthorchis viverrini]